MQAGHLMLFWYVLGWTLLSTTSASMLLPHKRSLRDRIIHCFSILSIDSMAVTKFRIFLHLVLHLTVIMPLVAWLWTVDEIIFSDYRNITIEEPLIAISVPRSGTTSLHRTLAKDPQLVTPLTSELVMPFICVNKILHFIHERFPSLLEKIEKILKQLSGVTPEVEARHPVSLFSPEADDVLIGEWQWVAVGSIRTFPVLSKWWDNYDFASFDHKERRRILSFHSLVFKKSLYLRGRVGKDHRHRRLLLRSHLSCCIEDFQEIYPDALFVGILRDPVDVLRSFAGLSDAVIQSAMGVQLLYDQRQHEDESNVGSSQVGCQQTSILDSTNIKSWPDAMQVILNDMMGREASLYSARSYRFSATKLTTSGASDHRAPTGIISFASFKQNPVAAIKNLYDQVGLDMSNDFKQELMRPQSMESFEAYKVLHAYTNPSLEYMGVNEDRFLSMPGVQSYKSLLQRIKRC